MTFRLKKLNYALGLIALGACLTGCSPIVKYPRPPIASLAPAGGAAAGAALGAVAGATAASAGIGAIAGAVIATSLSSEPHYLQLLKNEGIQVVQIGDNVRIIIPSDKTFELGTATILPRYYPALLNVIAFIQNYGKSFITVTGYTADSNDEPIANLGLSRTQAKSIMGFFWSHGIPFNHLRAVGKGDSDPIASNQTVLGSYYNRRIEVTFMFHENKYFGNFG